MMMFPTYYKLSDIREIERMTKTSQTSAKYIPKQSMKIKNKKRGAYDIIETREFSPRYGTVTGYEITIRLLRKKYRDVSYEQIEEAADKILVPKAVQNATQ